MLSRLFSTLTLWALIAGTLYLWGATAGVWLLTLLALLTQHELYELLRKMGHMPLRGLGLGAGAVMMLGVWYTAPGLAACAWILGVLVVMLGLMSLLLLVNPLKPSLQNSLMPTLWGVLYIPLMLQFYIQTLVHYSHQGHASTGLAVTLWLVAVAKFTDVGGLLVGSWLGRHKMAPLISPAKTWEGALGSLLTAGLVGYLGVAWARDCMPAGASPSRAAWAAVALGLVAIVSDLVQSVLKRQAKTKDSGYLIPGIGGAFDLTDSLILGAPVGYVFWTLWPLA
jgi:phosphatidate cytidylyltransferase